MEPTLTVQDPVQYVAELKLRQPGEIFDLIREQGAFSKDIVREGEQQAFISDKSMLSFGSGASVQYREDILNSALLAQLAAHKKFSLETDPVSWYQEFINVVKRVGWQFEGGEMDTFESPLNLFDVDIAILSMGTLEVSR